MLKCGSLIKSSGNYLRKIKIYRNILAASYKAFPNRTFCSVSEESKIVKSVYDDVNIPNVSFTEFLFKDNDKYRERVCLVNGDTGQSVTYEEVFQQTRRLASALSRLGVTKGDLVAIVAPNCPQFLVCFAAIASLGAVTTTVNTSFTSAEILKQLEDARPSVVFTHSLLLPKVREALEGSPFPRHLILMDGEGPGLIPLEKLLDDDGTGVPDVSIDPGRDLLVMPYSSGTTGLPKGVMLTHSNVVANLQQCSHPELSQLDTNRVEVFLGVLPMFHIYGLVAVMAMSSVIGGKLVTLQSFNPAQFVQVLRQHKPTVLPTVPPLLSFLTMSDHAPGDLLGSTHTVTCGAAPVGPALVERFFSKFGDSILFQEGYGMTETSPLTHLTPPGKLVIGSCGTAIPNTLTKLIDVSTGETIHPSEGSGELCVKGPQVMMGYYKNEEDTRETLSKDGWVRTGDIAVIDPEGNVFIVDRRKELIKVKGLQVAPAELEDLLRKHPLVEDVAVVGVEDERAGEVPRAFVVPSKNADLVPEDIENFVADRVAAHKRLLGGVVFIDTIPKSDTGKILRRKLV